MKNKGFCESNDNYLLLVISLDGFRYDYLDRYSNKDGFLVKFANQGFRAAYSESIFPSNTYPNHWSMVTGLRAEQHGVVNNEIYDPISNNQFRMAKDRENSEGWFQDREPVWIKNQKENGIKNKHSVVFDWPGGTASFDNIQPKVSRQIKRENWFLNTFNETIEEFVGSLERGHTNLAYLYLGEPDMAGHFYGPESKEVEKTVQELDYVLENLFNQLRIRKNYNIEDDIDVLIVTDHGMDTILAANDTALKRHFYLSDYLDVKKYLVLERCTYGSFSELWLQDEADVEHIYETIRGKLMDSEDSHKIRGMYMKKDIPERFHIKNHRRVAPIVLLAHSGYQIILDRDNSDKYSVSKYHGNHGYETDNELMRGTFLAKGKSFKKSFKSTKPVYLIDYYLLVCHLLGLTPNENNGTFSRISQVLEGGGEQYDEDLMQTLLKFGILFIIFLLIISFVMPSFLIFSSIKMTCDQPPSDVTKTRAEKTQLVKND